MTKNSEQHASPYRRLAVPHAHVLHASLTSHSHLYLVRSLVNPSRLARVYRRASFSYRDANGREARFPGTSIVFRSLQPFSRINLPRVWDAPNDRLNHHALQDSGRCRREWESSHGCREISLP